ncbi:TPA_asm: hypothetical protein GND67_002531 [Salmonella enterica subsp. salamae serovar 48:d:z6]|uniref:Uncharacterized protein n=1 Tax=Salmonella enterica subsp. salamae serovar 48:d:z6 TaxID=1151170 RepID=A0A729JQE0_SALER|nr:hypothetical protein [Salmonella enterica subsp. salamae serovar 48:d:z6]
MIRASVVASPANKLTDYSGHTVAGTSLEVIPAFIPTRLYRIQNLSSSETIWINDTGDPATSGAGSYALPPGAYYEFTTPFSVNIYADSAVPFSAARY